MPRRRVTLGNRKWKVTVARKPMKDWGQCIYDDKLIRLCPTTERHGVHREVFIHEVLHAIMPFLDEDCVKSAAIELDDALDAMEL